MCILKIILHIRGMLNSIVHSATGFGILSITRYVAEYSGL